jgi:ferritin
MSRTEKNVKATILFLQDLVAEGTLESGQMKVIVEGINILCRTRRSHDPARIWKAVDRLARVVLRSTRQK